MKLHRIALRDFRGVDDREVLLADTGVTVVAGPNEIGKSSLADALDMVLRLPDSSTAREVRDAVPVGHDVGPRVEVEMSIGPYRFVLAKQWVRGRMTSLDVLEPERRQLTGRDAHQWVQSTLDASLDSDLWNALRVAQGSADGPVDVHTRSLSKVLDAAMGVADTSGDETLVARVDAERSQYWTATGRPRRERVDLEAQLSDLDAHAADLERQIDELAATSTRVDELRAAHHESNASLLAARTQLEAAERSSAVLEAARRTLTDCDAAAESARAALASADAAVAHRREAADDLAGARADVDKLSVELERSSADAVDARSTLDLARARLAEIEVELVGVDGQVRSIDREVERRADIARHGDLQARLADAVEASQRAATSTERLERLAPIDAVALERIDASATQVVAAEARLSGASSHVRVTALADIDIEVDGVGHRVAAGESIDSRATRDTGIVVPGVAELRISPADGAADLADHAEAARASLAALCAELGVADAEEARRLHAARVTAERELAEALSDERRALRGSTLDDLRTDIEHVDNKIRLVGDTIEHVDETIPSGDGPFPELVSASESELGAALDVARARHTELSARRDDVAADLAHHQERVSQARLDDAALAARLEQAQHQHARLVDRLATARASHGDGVLEAAADRARREREDAEAAVIAARRAVADLRPDDIEADLAERRRAVRELDAAVTDLAREIDQLQTRLDISGERGLAGELDEVRTRREHLARRHDQIERRAAAAQTLHDAIVTHRDAARRRYAAPYRAELERLGRLVFGPDLELVLDEDLHVHRRVLGGVTLDVDQLSVGAREQLGLLARLACASIVGDDGVPVLFDDVLGHADPGRITAMGRALDAASSSSQVIITTCTPDRYAGIDATWVTLD